MAQSLSHVVVHAVFSTKHRAPLLKEREHMEFVHSFIVRAIGKIRGHVYAIGGTEDHVHILATLPKTFSPAAFVEDIKTSSSKYAKKLAPCLKDFYWQSGYAMFSVSESNVAAVCRYIARQREHHMKQSFQDELRAFFQKHHVAFDEKYVWD